MSALDERRFALAQSRQLRETDRIDFLGAEQNGTLVKVQFISDWLPYAAGETAHIAPSLASRIVPAFAELV